MATLSELAQIQAAINSLRGNNAYETPFAEDVALRLAPVASSTGFMSAGAFLEAVKNNPISTLLNWAAMLAGSGGASGTALSGAGAPIITPGFVGQLYHDTVADTYYRSTGWTSVDWVVISGGSQFLSVFPMGATAPIPNLVGTPGITELVWNIENLGTSFDMSGCPELVTIDVGALTTISGDFNVSGSPAITKLNAGALYTVGGSFSIFGCPVLADLSVASLTTIGGTFYASGCTALTVLEAGALVTTTEFNAAGCDLLATIDARSLTEVVEFDVSSCPVLTSLNVDRLTTVNGSFSTVSCSALVTLDVGALVTVTGTFRASNCPLLTSVLCDALVPPDGSSMSIRNSALSADSVERILRRYVLAGVTTCDIDLSLGTSAGLAALSAQGQADAATLGAQLTINP